MRKSDVRNKIIVFIRHSTNAGALRVKLSSANEFGTERDSVLVCLYVSDVCVGGYSLPCGDHYWHTNLLVGTNWYLWGFKPIVPMGGKCCWWSGFRF